MAERNVGGSWQYQSWARGSQWVSTTRTKQQRTVGHGSTVVSFPYNIFRMAGPGIFDPCIFV